jgi:DNA-binding NarL/FixJ family response regulator
VIRILIVDDHPVVRDGLRGMFAGDDRFDVVGEAGDGREALAVARGVTPDVVLMDLRMPGMDGVSTIEALRDQGFSARVLVLTTYDTDSDVLPAIKAGATGYLLKDTPREELFRAGRLMGRLRSPGQEPLSQRELEVLTLTARGCTNRETASRLFISEATVKTHLLHVYAKLGVRDRAAAVAAAFERGLLGT